MEPRKNIIQQIIAHINEIYNNYLLRKMRGTCTYSDVYHDMKHYGYKSTDEYARANAFKILFGRD